MIVVLVAVALVAFAALAWDILNWDIAAEYRELQWDDRDAEPSCLYVVDRQHLLDRPFVSTLADREAEALWREVTATIDQLPEVTR